MGKTKKQLQAEKKKLKDQLEQCDKLKSLIDLKVPSTLERWEQCDEKIKGNESRLQQLQSELEELDVKNTQTLGIESVKKTVRLNEQCALLQIPGIYEKSNEVKEDWKLFDPDPGGVDHHDFISQIAEKGMSKFVNITPAQHAILQPEIRLWKVVYPTENSPGVPIEFNFPKHIDLPEDFSTAENILSGRGRGGAIGIKKFEYELLGKNPATTDNYIKAKLVLFFQNMTTLTEPAVNNIEGIDYDIKFLDLVLRSGPRNSKSEIRNAALERFGGNEKDYYAAMAKAAEDNYSYGLASEDAIIDELAVDLWNPKYFKIKADIGWAVPPHGATEIEGFDSELLNQIINTKISLFMSLLRHDFNFNQDGTVELSIEYIGMVESMLAGPDADILAPRDESASELRKLKERKRIKSRQLLSVPKDSRISIKKEIKQIDEKIITSIAADRIEQYPKIFKWLFDNEQIFEVSVPREAVGIGGLKVESTFFGLGQDKFTDDSEIVVGSTAAADAGDAYAGKKISVTRLSTRKTKTMADKQLEDIKSGIQNKSSQPQAADTIDMFDNRPTYDIRFVYFGSILQAALSSLQSGGRYVDPEIEDIKILTGPVDLRGLNIDKERINISQIPIPMKVFKQFFNDKVVRSQRKSYSLIKFIKDVVSELVVGAAGRYCIADGAGASPISLKPAIALFSTRHNKSFIRGGYIQGTEHNLYIYASQEAQPGLTGREGEDAKLGIYHFYIGRDRGLLKEINFSKTNVPGLSEARIIDRGEGGLGQLMEKYDAKLKLIGNSLFKPGMKIFINPTLAGMGSTKVRHDIARTIGLGGYYDVIKVRSELSRDGFETELETSWTSYPDGTLGEIY